MGIHGWLDEWDSNADALATEASLVCARCVLDRELWRRVEAEAEPDNCSFCDHSSSCVSFATLEMVIQNVVESFYLTLEESGAFHDEGEWSERVEDIQDIVGVLLDEAVSASVYEPLKRFTSESMAVPYGWVHRRAVWATLYDYHAGDWATFMDEARTGDPLMAANGLVQSLSPQIRKLFSTITEIATQQGLFDRAQPVVWRCRSGALTDKYTGAGDIGTAPDGFAAGGRLNAAGHSCFYGSTTKRGAVIESAKHGGTELWTGRFRPSRAVFYFDVLVTPQLPSPFAEHATDTYAALDFLSTFAETISQPNDPADVQHYLPTQIFTAYLLSMPYDAPEAIRFASSIDPASENWVFFVDHDHCVEPSDLANDELFLVIDPASVEHLDAADFA